MHAFINDIDGLLRGRYTGSEDLRVGRIVLPARTLLLGGLALGGAYGVFMGLYGISRPGNASFLQLFATTVKVPMLFLLTLAVSLPSLYVLSALAGSRLRFPETLRLLLASVAVNLAMLASLGPVLGFFTLSTQSYPFMVVMNVGFFAAAGLVGMGFLRRALDHVFPPEPQTDVSVLAKPDEKEEPVENQEPETKEGPDQKEWTTSSSMPGEDEGVVKKIVAPRARALERVSVPPGARVFRAWIVVYGVVGAQMGWIMRPFIGSPDLPFEWFRTRESNFLAGFFRALDQLLS